MSSDFVRYTPEIESIDPQIDELTAQIIEFWERKAVEKGDALAFNQWRATAEHRPLGEIMQVRRIYAASANVRRTLDHQPQTEPTSADEVLA
jgi:hypothetical protein